MRYSFLLGSDAGAPEIFIAAFTLTQLVIFQKKQAQEPLLKSPNNMEFCCTNVLTVFLYVLTVHGKCWSPSAERGPPPHWSWIFWHQTWISISLRSPKTICPVSLLLTGKCCCKQKNRIPSLPSLASLGIQLILSSMASWTVVRLRQCFHQIRQRKHLQYISQHELQVSKNVCTWLMRFFICTFYFIFYFNSSISMQTCSWTFARL